VVGTAINGVTVRHVDDLPDLVAESNIAIGIIATPASAAQEVADRLVAAGVTSVLNFAPTILSVPDEVSLRKVDLAVELQILSFYQRRKGGDGQRRSSIEAGPAAPAPARAGRTVPGGRASEATGADDNGDPGGSDAATETTSAPTSG
jgi:redox-sensing transcriptional repressor